MDTNRKEIIIEKKEVKDSIVSRISLVTIMIMTAILLLISVLVNRRSYSIEINESVTISRKVVEIIGYIPSGYWLTILLIIYLIYCIIRGGAPKLIGYIISLMVIEVGIELTMSALMLENVTNLYIVKVNQTIPIETRLEYLNLGIIDCYRETTILNKMIESKLQDIATSIERSVEVLRLNEMNAQEITSYARELFTSSVKENDRHSSLIEDMSRSKTIEEKTYNIGKVLLSIVLGVGILIEKLG